MFVFVTYYLIVIATGASMFFAVIIHCYQLAANLTSARKSKRSSVAYAAKYARYL